MSSFLKKFTLQIGHNDHFSGREQLRVDGHATIAHKTCQDPSLIVIVDDEISTLSIQFLLDKTSNYCIINIFMNHGLSN